MTRVVLALVMLVVGLWPAPVAADPARPGDYRSTIDAVEPVPDGVTVEIVGGDSFLRVRAEAGREVVVQGYAGEPYVRIRADGVVEENANSPATYINADRYADVAQPDVDPEDPPEWRQVDDDGEHLWHDHRIHFMSPSLPEGVERGDVVLEWEVPLEVDGEPVMVRGTLVLVEDVNPLPWAAAALVALAVVVVAGRRVPAAASLAVVAASVLALVVGAGERAATPGDSGNTPMVVVVPAIALVAGLAAVALRRRPVAVVLLLAAVAALAGWGLLRLGVLTNPVLPTELPFAVDRAGTALGLGVAAGAAVVALRTAPAAGAPAVRPTPDRS